MSKQNDGGSAFPNVFTDQINGRDGEQSTDTYSCGGMSLRQWYKGQLSRNLTGQCVAELFEHKGKPDEQKMVLDHFTEAVGMIADALIAEDAARAKEG
jgi:hypothetical protein